MDETTTLSIKEFSEFSGINQTTLRYYDEIGLLPPASRKKNKYRYYTPFQLIKLNYIRVLENLGVKLSAIKDMDSNRTPEKVIELLSQQETKLHKQVYELTMAASILHTYRKNISRGLTAEGGTIRLEEHDDANYVLGDPNDFKNYITFYEEFIRFCRSARKNRINLDFPIGGFHKDMNAFLNAPGWPEHFFSQDPLGNCLCPGGTFLVGYIRGYYGNFGDLPQKMAIYAKDHHLVFNGPVYSLYLLDEISVIKPDQYLSSVSVRVKTDASQA